MGLGLGKHLILFFSKMVLLTPSPITLSENWIEIIPEKPLIAITGGAAIYVDVSSITNNFEIDSLREKFPKNSIQPRQMVSIKLITNNNR